MIKQAEIQDSGEEDGKNRNVNAEDRGAPQAVLCIAVRPSDKAALFQQSSFLQDVSKDVVAHYRSCFRPFFGL